MMNAKLMSYNQIDFQSKFHMEAMIKQMESVDEKMRNKFKEAGLLSFTVTQIWNKQGKYRLGVYYAYRDEKAFVNCQKLLNSMPTDDDNPVIQNADRGIVVYHVDLTD